jgi:hypothetical protein
MKLHVELSEDVYKFQYAKNSHYIELEDIYGNKIKLSESSLVEGICQDCDQIFYVKSNLGSMICPHCASKNVVFSWVSPQLAFVPLSESTFKCPKKKE